MSSSAQSFIDSVMKVCGVVIPTDVLDSLEPQAVSVLQSYGCENDPNAVRLMEYLLALPNRDTTKPCIEKLGQLFMLLCDAAVEDLVF